MDKGIIALIFLVNALGGSLVAAAAPAETNRVTATLVADTTAIQAGRPFTLGVLLKIAPKWHIYWSNSGDAGIPTTVGFHLPPGFSASAIQYPIPVRIVQAGDIVMFGYSDEVMLLATITPPGKIASTEVAIASDVNWLVCDDQTCTPGQAKPSLNLQVSDTPRANQTELFSSWIKRLPVPAQRSVHVRDCRSSVSWQSSSPTKSSGQISISIDWKSQAPSSVEWFPPACEGVQFGTPQIQSNQSTTTIRVPIDRFGQSVRDGSLESVVGFKMGDDLIGISVPVNISAVH